MFVFFHHRGKGQKRIQSLGAPRFRPRLELLEPRLAPATVGLLGIDISTYQTSVHWDQVRNANVAFALVKATEGTYQHAEDYLATNIPAAQAKDIAVGVYHLANPSADSRLVANPSDMTELAAEARAEADFFARFAAAYCKRGYLQPALDIEPAQFGFLLPHPDRVVTWVKEWIAEVKRDLGVQISPILYMDQTRAQKLQSVAASLTKYPLWIAAWNSKRDPSIPPTTFGPWTTWAVHQYADDGTVAGINRPVDLDVLNPSISLKSLKIGDSALVSSLNPSSATANGPSDDGTGSDDSDRHRVSADGRFVAFSSAASNLVPGDTNNSVDIFVSDLLTGQITRASTDSADTELDAGSFYPSISADGRYVAFQSEVAGRWQVFVKDRQTRQLIEITPNGDGLVGSYAPTISGNGRCLVFISDSSNLVDNDTNGGPDVFVANLVAHTITRASNDELGGQAVRPGFEHPSISDDGRYVAFESTWADPFDANSSASFNIFVKHLDLANGVLTSTGALIQANSDDTGQKGWTSLRPSLSGDGRYVAYLSASAPGGNGFNQVIRKALQTGQAGKMVFASTDGTGALGLGNSTLPSLSEDGRYVAFSTGANNLTGGDPSNGWQIVVKDLLNREVKLVSADNTSAIGNSDSVIPSISGNGSHVVFSSLASNLVPGTFNNSSNVFLWTDPRSNDIALQSAVTKDAKSLDLDYTTTGATAGKALSVSVFRSSASTAAAFSVTNAIRLGDATVPGSPGNVVPHHVHINLGFSIGIDRSKQNPYIYVVINPTGSNHVAEEDDPDNKNDVVSLGALSADTLYQIMQFGGVALSAADAVRLIDPLNRAFGEFAIVTPKRQAAFLAQADVASIALTQWAESRKSDMDGGRPNYLRGRGPLKLKGEDTYRAAQAYFGFFEDIYVAPWLIADADHRPELGFLTSAWYWSVYKGPYVNLAADSVDPTSMQSVNRINTKITGLVTGGLSHLADHLKAYNRALSILQATG